MKLNKKLFLLGLPMILSIGISAPLIVSCSASAMPIQEVNSKFGDVSFTIGNSFKANGEGITIDGKKFTTRPEFKKEDVTSQKASAVFDIVGSFSTWLNGIATSVSTIISRSPETKSHKNPVTAATNAISQGLDYALASYLGRGGSTYRLGIREIICTTTVDQIAQLVKPYNENDFIAKDEKPSEQSNEPKPVSLMFTGIQIKYSWWKTNGSNGNSWVDQNSFNAISANNDSNKDYYGNANMPPKFEYLLSFKNISCQLRQYSDFTRKVDNKDVLGWIPSGRLSLLTQGKDDKITTYVIDGTTSDDTATLFNLVDKGNKTAAGDFANEKFNKFIKSEDGVKLNTILLPKLLG